MQNAKILPVMTLGLMLGALAADHLVVRLEPVRAKLLSVDKFPRRVGQWIAGPDRRLSPEAQAKMKEVIPTAHVVDRVYTDPAGHWIDVTLVTATEYNDLHNPMHCLPAQGWQLGALVPCRVGGDQATSTVGTNDGQKMEVLYWYTASTYRHDTVAERFRAIRTMAGGSAGDSLLVRLITDESPESKQQLLEFAREMEGPLQPLKDEARAR